MTHEADTASICLGSPSPTMINKVQQSKSVIADLLVAVQLLLATTFGVRNLQKRNHSALFDSFFSIPFIPAVCISYAAEHPPRPFFYYYYYFSDSSPLLSFSHSLCCRVLKETNLYISHVNCTL